MLQSGLFVLPLLFRGFKVGLFVGILGFCVGTLIVPVKADPSLFIDPRDPLRKMFEETCCRDTRKIKTATCSFKVLAIYIIMQKIFSVSFGFKYVVWFKYFFHYFCN